MRSVFGLVGSFAVLVFLATTAGAAERVNFSLEFETGECAFGETTFSGANSFSSFDCPGVFIDPQGTLSGTFTCVGVSHTNFEEFPFPGESHSTLVLTLDSDGSVLIWRSESTFTLDPQTFATLSISGNTRLLSAEGPGFGDEVIAAVAKFVGDGFDPGPVVPSTFDGHYIIR